MTATTAGNAERASLPATAWAVLGLLSFGRELTGYELKKWADHSLAFFWWSPAVSQIYGELRRLEGLGYVTSREVPKDDLRNKRVHRITPAGVAALRAWAAAAPVEPPVLKHGVLLRVWLGHLAEPDRLRDIVKEHRDRAGRAVAALQVDQVAAEKEPTWTFPRLVLAWGERYYQAEHDLAESLLRDLATLRAPPGGFPDGVLETWARQEEADAAEAAQEGANGGAETARVDGRPRRVRARRGRLRRQGR